jgi:hypothetical protein
MLTNIWQTIKERWLNLRQPKPAEAVIQQVPVTVIGDRPQTPAATPVETPVKVTQPVVVAAPAPQPVPDNGPIVQQPIAVAAPAPEPVQVVQQQVVAAEPTPEPAVSAKVKKSVQTRTKMSRATKLTLVEKKSETTAKKSRPRKPKAT